MVSIAGAMSAPTILSAKPSKQYLQCKALNKCRHAFTRCYYRVKGNPKKDWERDDDECVIPYRKCIDKAFPDGGMWFTRWFNPKVLDCKEYR
jgi:hypothetical protein